MKRFHLSLVIIWGCLMSFMSYCTYADEMTPLPPPGQHADMGRPHGHAKCRMIQGHYHHGVWETMHYECYYKHGVWMTGYFACPKHHHHHNHHCKDGNWVPGHWVRGGR